MESSICVAVITGLPSKLHFLMSSFCIIGTVSGAISTPRSPRATIRPSEIFRISSMLSIPSWFSILGIILMYSPSCDSSISRISSTSWARLTKLAAIKSTPCSMPNFTSSLSFSVKPGSFTLTPGTLTPFLFFKRPLFLTVVVIMPVSLFSSSISSSTSPSSRRIKSPGSTSSISPS